MYKLLPDEQKKKVAREYFWRRTIVVLWSLIFVTIIGIAGLFPSYILSNARQEEINERLKAMGSAELSAEDQGIISWLEKTNLKLKVLSPELDKGQVSSLVEKALEAKISGVKISSLDWTKENSKELFVISGVAADRQSLIAFENELKGKQIGNVSLPVSNLAKERNINFIVRITPSP